MLPKRLTGAATTIVEGLASLASPPRTSPTSTKSSTHRLEQGGPLFEATVTPESPGVCGLTLDGLGLAPHEPITYQIAGEAPEAFDAVGPNGTYSAQGSCAADGSTVTFATLTANRESITSTITLSC